MNRFLLCLILSLACLLPGSAAPPNIVFIIADDLGWADVAFHGGNAPTPHLDKLAKDGLELTQHYVAPVCSPTRAGFLTGRCWSRFGITTPTNSRGLPWETVTVARALKSQGYDTALIGKWHLGSKPEEGPNHYGFDHSYGSLAGGVSPWNHHYKKGPWTVTWHRNEKLIEEEGHVTDLLTDEAVKWIGERGENPFFLYLPYTAIHLPLKEPKEWVDKAPASIKGDVPRHYAASVMHLDHGVGRVLKALEKKGVEDNTLVIFTSDNGGSTAENNDLKYPDDNCPNGKLVGNNLPLRGQKGNIWEGGTRVPTIVSWPGKIAKGKEDTPVVVTDWMPTFCTLAGFKPEKDLKWDGTDLSGLLLQKRALKPRSIYIAGTRWKDRSLRNGDWKLIVSGEGEKQKTYLYNITEDISEKTDLAKKHPEKVQHLMQELKRISAADKDSVVKK